MMRPILILLLVSGIVETACAQMQQLNSVRKANRTLSGQIDDFTRNHFHCARVPSQILGMKRDLYVYLPPGYTPCQRYPLVLWCHGGFGDEHSFLNTANLESLDQMIRAGCCPPMIVAAPDLTFSGRNLITTNHSLGANSAAGRMEDHIMQEVIPWLMCHYSIAPERELHAITGVSAGGTAAMSLALRHREFFGAVASIAGALNLRYDTCSGNYFEDFSPETFRWKTTYSPRQVIGKFMGGFIRIHASTFIGPVFGRDPGMLDRVKAWNPSDLIESTNLGPGELRIYIRYGDRDNLNLDAHGASFAWLARQRGVQIDEDMVPGGQHDPLFFRTSGPHVWRWLCQQFGSVNAVSEPGLRP